MEVKVEHPADLFRLLEPAYERFVLQTSDDRRFDVTLLAAEYVDENLKLLDLHDSGHADVRVHPDSDNGRVRFVNGYVQVSAGSIHLDNLVLDHRTSGYPMLHLTARNTITLANCAFTRLRHEPAYAGEALMRIRPGFQVDAPATLHIDGCAWIANREAVHSSLITLEDSQRRWDSVTIENCVFLANEAGMGIVLGGTKHVTIRSCVLDAGTVPDFLVMSSPYTRITIENCVLLGDASSWILRLDTPIADDSGDSPFVPESLDPELAPDEPDSTAAVAPLTLRNNLTLPTAVIEKLNISALIEQAQVAPIDTAVVSAALRA